MNYPLLSEYIEAIRSAEDNFGELSYLKPVFGDDGLPVMTSGNFAVVFKMRDERDNKLYAVKCFTKEQEGRAEAYQLITEELKDVDSPYLTSIRYLDKEMFVDTNQTNEKEFPVILMEWVEGQTMDKYIRKVIDNEQALRRLSIKFRQLAIWLLKQPFAHGDLKPDNILVKNDDSLVLVDYDGVFVPKMKGQKARELGSPDFRNPLRTEIDFDKNIDSFPLIIILLSLELMMENKDYLTTFGADDRLLFSEKNFRDIENCQMFQIATKSPRNNIIELVKILKEELEGHKHLPKMIISIINGEERDVHNHVYDIKDNLELIAKFLFGLYSLSSFVFPFIAFILLEWRVLDISFFMLVSNIIAYLLFNIIDSCRQNKKNHILEESTIGCLGLPTPIIPLFFMASSSYEEEWYTTAIIWIISWLSFMTFGAITSLKDSRISLLFYNIRHKKKEKIKINEIIEELEMALLLAPAFGFPFLIVMIIEDGWNAFFVWLKYIAIIDTFFLVCVIISWIFRGIGK